MLQRRYGLYYRVTQPCFQFREHTLLCFQQRELFGELHGTPLANYSTGYNTASISETLHGDKR